MQGQQGSEHAGLLSGAEHKPGRQRSHKKAPGMTITSRNTAILKSTWRLACQQAKRPAAVLCQLLQRVVFDCLPLLFASLHQPLHQPHCIHQAAAFCKVAATACLPLQLAVLLVPLLLGCQFYHLRSCMAWTAPSSSITAG